MSNMVDEYTLMLIKQYWEKPKARAEIELSMRSYSKIADLFKQVITSLDIDQAVGVQLDMIGKAVGLSRNVPEVIPKVFFGFAGGDNVEGFSDKFNVSRIGAPFLNKFSPTYSSLQLDDDRYRRFLKVKIASNTASAFMVSDDHISIQDAVQLAFNGRAYAVDNQDMSITLYVESSVGSQEIRLIRKMNILPRPQGVSYRFIVQSEIGKTFGFAENPDSKGFADKFNPLIEGGFFARKIF